MNFAETGPKSQEGIVDPKLNDLRKIALGGVDSITSAIVLSLKRAGFKGALYGVDSAAVITQAWNNGCVTDGGTEWKDALPNCKLVVLSRQSRNFRARLAKVLELAEPDTIILDASSVKGYAEDVIVASGREDIRHIGFFLVHEQDHANEDTKPSHFFFDGKTIILTPRSRTDLAAFKMLSTAFDTCGAKVIPMYPQAFYERLAMLDFVPDLLEFLELEAVLASTSADKITAEHLGQRLYARLKRLAELHQSAWHDSLIGTRSQIDCLLANIQLSIQTVREDLLAGSFEARVASVLAKGDYLHQQTIEAASDEIVVATKGDSQIMQRIARLLSESCVVVTKLEELKQDSEGTYKLRLESKEHRNKAVSLLKSAGIKVEFKD